MKGILKTSISTCRKVMPSKLNIRKEAWKESSQESEVQEVHLYSLLSEKSNEFYREYDLKNISEPLYCYCQTVSYGQMIACDDQFVNCFCYKSSVRKNGSILNAF